MGRSSQAWTEEKIQKHFAEGFGSGVGRDYKPWLTVGRSMPSVGTSNRSGARTTGRVHHYLSNIEWNAFLIYDCGNDHANALFASDETMRKRLIG